MAESDLFADLRSLESSEIQSNLLTHEASLVDIDAQLTKNRTLTSFRSSCIKVCVGKSNDIPSKNPELQDDLAETTLSRNELNLTNLFNNVTR